MSTISIIIPAKNEEAGLHRILPELCATYSNAEIIISNDGSTDGTKRVAEEYGCKVVSSPYSMGNGAAIKRGARAAQGDILVMMDADGQHQPDDVGLLLNKLHDGYDMVVGARDAAGQASRPRAWANRFYNCLASLVSGHNVEDLTSGFRAVKADKFREYLYLLPNGFSYPTTSTMAFFRNAYAVCYVPISAEERTGRSHIKPLRDGLRFLLIIFKIATLYSPLKLFVPIAMAFLATGLAYYGYTYTAHGRFTNMSTLLLSASVIIFLIGLISEQITALTYKRDG